MKSRFLIIIGICVFILSAISISESFAVCLIDEETGKAVEPCRGLPVYNIPYALSKSGSTYSIINDIVTTSDHIKEISLNWDGSKKEPVAKITFDKIINDTITIYITKDIPRFANLDFGVSLHAVQTDGSWKEIRESKSPCFYVLRIPVVNSDYVEIEFATVATGTWTSVSIMNQACGDYSLKQQIENNIPSDEINCRDKQHYVFERPGGKLACVNFSSGEKLGWHIVPDY